MNRKAENHDSKDTPSSSDNPILPLVSGPIQVPSIPTAMTLGKILQQIPPNLSSMCPLKDN